MMQKVGKHTKKIVDAGSRESLSKKVSIGIEFTKLSVE